MSEIYENVVEEAIQYNDKNFAEMLDSVKNVVTHYHIKRASTDIFVRKNGYNGFTVAFTHFKPTGDWFAQGDNETPDSIQTMIDLYGIQLETDEEFYKASKAYSQWKYGE